MPKSMAACIAAFQLIGWIPVQAIGPKSGYSAVKTNPITSVKWDIGYDASHEAPVYFRASRIESTRSDLSQSAPPSSQSAKDLVQCQRFLRMLAPRLNASGEAKDFGVRALERHPKRAHFHVQQLAKGIPIFGAEGKVVIRHDTEAVYIGRFRNAAMARNAVTPKVSDANAYLHAWKHLGLFPGAIPPLNPDSSLVTDKERHPELVYFPVEAGALRPTLRLAWHLAIRPNILELWEYLIDAHDGAVLLTFPVHCDAGPMTATAKDLLGNTRTFGTYQNATDNKYYLIDAARPMFNATRSRFPDQTVGTILTMDMNNTPQSRPVYSHITTTNNTWTNPTAVSAHYNATLAYEYYLKTFNRNSINGSGGNIRSFINVPGTDGQAMDNAYWNGNAMYYGNGRTSMKPLAGGLDVAGHELTHGVVGATAALRYVGQSGALNESLADIFGSMIERNNWKIGEDVVKTTYFPTGALRDMSNPNQGLRKGNQGWQPAHMNEYQTLPNTQAGDNGGVHVNSGIPNRAYYLFATAIGKEKAEQVYYKALTQYLSASSQFVDMRLAVTTSAQDLYGVGSPEEKAAEEAFAAVGIGAPAVIVPKTNSWAPHTGQQFALLTRAGAGDGNTLYLTDSAMTNPRPLSKTPLSSRPTVTDDGSFAIFVAKDGRIMKLNTDPANPQETVLEPNPVWEIAAISKDGKRFAGLKKSHDSSIYVGDIATNRIQRFPLYNPTNEGFRTGGVVYAGSLDWDLSGENVIYDAFNQLRGSGTSVIEYWDIGIINVWDSSANQYATGEIRKPLGDLPDGASVGNPVFAKNSPDVVVYEFITELNEFSIRTIDLETRKTGILTTNTIISFPSYDKRDASVAYNTLVGRDTVIAIMGVKSDKITAGSSAKTVATGFKWPVVFARGNRLNSTTGIPNAPEGQPETFGLKAYHLPGNSGLTVQFTLSRPGTARLSLWTLSGRQFEAKSVFGLPGLNHIHLTSSTSIPRGVSLVRLEAHGKSAQTQIVTQGP